VLAYCKFIRRGLDRLDGTGRQRLLRLLLDRVVVHPRRLEIHGVLQAHDEGPQTDPDGSGRNRPDSPESRSSYDPVHYSLSNPGRSGVAHDGPAAGRQRGQDIESAALPGRPRPSTCSGSGSISADTPSDGSTISVGANTRAMTKERSVARLDVYRLAPPNMSWEAIALDVGAGRQQCCSRDPALPRR